MPITINKINLSNNDNDDVMDYFLYSTRNIFINYNHLEGID
ncbi:1845_t:CDS:1, partial [Funneliformis geosporum]